MMSYIARASSAALRKQQLRSFCAVKPDPSTRTITHILKEFAITYGNAIVAVTVVLGGVIGVTLEIAGLSSQLKLQEEKTKALEKMMEEKIKAAREAAEEKIKAAREAGAREALEQYLKYGFSDEYSALHVPRNDKK